MVLVSVIEIDVRNRRQRERPQRCWLMSRSAMVMLSASQGQSSTIWATLASPSATWRLSSARASRTRLACASACMCCGAGAVAVVPMKPPRYIPRSLRGCPSFFMSPVLRPHEIHRSAAPDSAREPLCPSQSSRTDALNRGRRLAPALAEDQRSSCLRIRKEHEIYTRRDHPVNVLRERPVFAFEIVFDSLE